MSKNKTEQNGSKEDEKQEEFEEVEFVPPTPPDGGWGWAVMVASFFCNMIVDGVCYTFGIFFTELVDYFGSTKSETALVGALVPGMYLIVGPIVSALANKFGCRIVTIIGSIIAAAFFVLSSFSTSIKMMMATYGVMGGVGFGLMYLPSIVMVGYYFDKKRALATGVAVCGSGIGTFIFAPLGTFLVDEYGWKGANIIIGALILNGIVFGAIFRPLEPTRRVVRQSTIINKIVDEKRKRTYSVDDATITEDNRVVRSADATDGTKTHGSQQLVVSTGGQDHGKGDTHNSNTSLGSRKSQKRGQFLDVEGQVVGVPRSRRNSASVTVSQKSLYEKKKAVASPFARQDALYTGSIRSLKEYQQAGNHETYISSVMHVAQDDGEVEEKTSCMTPIMSIITQMFDFSLLKSLTFILISGAGVLCFLGLYTPFVYVTEKARRELGIAPSRANLILSVLGVCNTVSRVVAGLVADNPRVDCLIVHNTAAIVAGGLTCLVSVFNSYGLLMMYGALFGVSIAAFIALRSIVIVELLGLQKLTNAFGLTSLFQGIAVLIGSPLSGAIQESTNSYVGPFLVSGSLIALGGIICLPVRRIAAWEKAREQKSRGKYSKVNGNQ